MKMPEPQFSSWHGEDCKTLLNPTGVCNAFTWPPRIPEDEYWMAKGYHGEPLYTAEQMKQYGRDLLEEAAALVAPKRQRPCDCGVCDCGNRDDAQRVAEWDADNTAAQEIRKLKETL
jgi:hypothetical protein